MVAGGHDEAVSVFETELRAAVDLAVQRLQEIDDNDTRSGALRYVARILDLLDRARAHGISTDGWVPGPLYEIVRGFESR